MHNKHWLIVFFVVVNLAVDTACAMGIRSFVALPVDKGGTVVRVQYQNNTDTDTDGLVANAAYGLSGKQTLLFGIPYQLSSGSSDRTGDLSTLYRHIIWQDDTAAGTRRLGLLGGVVIPTDSARDAQIQAGAVATFYKGRTEWDLDVLWIEGLNNAANRARYDIAWQYRLSPAVYPDWGIGHEWNIDLELGGRWDEGNTMVHQATIGLQSIHRRWVFEGGVVQDLNESEETRILLSTRFHF
jgi:hypothetical protein